MDSCPYHTFHLVLRISLLQSRWTAVADVEFGVIAGQYIT
jgi:hypothetical protein